MIILIIIRCFLLVGHIQIFSKSIYLKDKIVIVAIGTFKLKMFELKPRKHKNLLNRQITIMQLLKFRFL